MMKLALAQWEGAVGLQDIKSGFCFDPSYDALFALGWPHLRVLTDEPVDAYRQGMALLHSHTFDLGVCVPRDLASGLVRAWAAGELFITTPTGRVVRDEVEAALWNAEPFSRMELVRLLSKRMNHRAALWADRRASETMVLLAEALTQTEWVAAAIVGALEGMDAQELRQQGPTQSQITFQLGYLLLRMPKARSAKLRARAAAVLHGPSGLGIHGGGTHPVASSHLGALALVLGGAATAERHTDHDIRWYTHVVRSPKTIMMRARINRSPTLPDPRMLFLGGAELLDTRFGTYWSSQSPEDQRNYALQLAPIKAPQVVCQMAKMAHECPAVSLIATEWCQAHSGFALPVLKAQAERSAPWALAMLEGMG